MISAGRRHLQLALEDTGAQRVANEQSLRARSFDRSEVRAAANVGSAIDGRHRGQASVPETSEQPC